MSFSFRFFLFALNLAKELSANIKNASQEARLQNIRRAVLEDRMDFFATILFYRTTGWFYMTFLVQSPLLFTDKNSAGRFFSSNKEFTGRMFVPITACACTSEYFEMPKGKFSWRQSLLITIKGSTTKNLCKYCL